MTLAAKYKKSFDEQWCLQFKTRHPEGDTYHGVVVSLADGFVAIREVSDFDFDGVIVFPKRSIKGIRDNRYDQCANEVLRENGQFKKPRTPEWLKRCTSLRDLLVSLMKRDVWPAIEILFDDNKENALYLGPITKIEDDNFWIRCYDAAGKWEKEYKLTLDEIFRVEFDSRYCTNFNAYMSHRPFGK